MSDETQRSMKRQMISALLLTACMIVFGCSLIQVPTPVPQTSTPSPTLSPTGTPTPGVIHRLEVPADRVWYDTGVVLQIGQVLEISAQGISNISGQPNNNIWEPHGDNGSCPSDCLLPGAGYGTLVGRIYDGQPFEVGASFRTTVAESGALFLAINDNEPYYFDNTGFYFVEIKIW